MEVYVFFKKYIKIVQVVPDFSFLSYQAIHVAWTVGMYLHS